MHDLVGGRYELLEELGRGGFGTVSLAREPSAPDTLWALKEIDFSDMGAAECNALHQFFDREQKILSWLNHTAIAQRREVIIDGARLYLVMEYVEGADLQRVVSANFGLISPGAAVGLVEHICEILFYLHSQKPYPIVFRDLKPSNLMLTTTGVVKLIDFGIARMYRPVTEAVPEEEETGDLPNTSEMLATLGASQVLGGARARKAAAAAAQATTEEVAESVREPRAIPAPAYSGPGATEYLGTLPTSTPPPQAVVKPAAQAPTEWLGIAGLGKSEAPRPQEPPPVPPGVTENLGTRSEGILSAREGPRPDLPLEAPPSLPSVPKPSARHSGPAPTEFLGTLPGTAPRHTGPAPTEYLGTRPGLPSTPAAPGSRGPVAPGSAEGPGATEWLGTVPAGPAPTEWLGTASSQPSAAPPRQQQAMAAPPRAAKAPPPKQNDSLCLGTPGYAAPEQYPGSGLQPDPRADIYALGVILYQLLSQQNPAGLEVPLPPIRRFNSSVHPDLEQIIARATAPDRDQRYSSVKMFSKALADFRQAKLLLSPEGVNRELKELAGHYRPPVRAKPMDDLLKEIKTAKHDATRVGTRFDAMKQTNKKKLRTYQRAAAGAGAAGFVLLMALLLVPATRLPVLALGAAGGAWVYQRRKRRKRR